MTETELKATGFRIRKLMSVASRNVIAIGRELREVHQGIEDGKFRSWVRDEFKWSHVTAYHFMRVADQFGEHEELACQFDSTALLLLAKDGLSGDAAKHCLKLARSGERVTWSCARDAIREFSGIEAIPRKSRDPKREQFLNRIRTVVSRWAAQISELDDDERSQILRFLLKFCAEELGWNPEESEMLEAVQKISDYLEQAGTARPRIIAVDLGMNPNEVSAALASGPFQHDGNGYYFLKKVSA